MYSYARFLQKFILFLLLVQLVNSQTNEEIILNLNSSYKPDYSYNLLSFIEDLHERNLYTIINIGEPQYEIKTFLTVQNEYMALIPNKIVKENISYTKYNYTK